MMITAASVVRTSVKAERCVIAGDSLGEREMPTEVTI
jgi:hypothetical protein